MYTSGVKCTGATDYAFPFTLSWVGVPKYLLKIYEDAGIDIFCLDNNNK
jgi:hypothetical protein